MTGHMVEFGGQMVEARASGALWWAGAGLLCVADLHLGKSGRLARRGGVLLPPYETAETLARLEAELEATGARRVVCLGDSFDDGLAEAAMDAAHRQRLWRMMAGRDWTWIAGNHDPVPGQVGGTMRAALHEAGIVFRHMAERGADRPEISAHYHPKWRLAGRARPCFLVGGGRMVLPAFGAYTGGLHADDPVLAALFPGGALAVMTGARALAVPVVAQVRGTRKGAGWWRMA